MIKISNRKILQLIDLPIHLSHFFESIYMKKLLLILVTICVSGTSYATEATDATAKKLLRVTKAEKMVEASHAQLRPLMEGMIKSSRLSAAEQEKALADFRKNYPQIEKVFRDELSFEKLEPEYLAIYKATFSEEELVGMIDFYESPSGQAVLNKMPQVIQNTMGLVQKKIPLVIQKVEKTIKESK